MVLVYTFTIFLSAALMFMVQPMIGKMILPTLGGAPAVWNTCLVFFQALLLGGYLYAHFSIKWLGHRVQSLLHIAVLGATLCWLIWRWIQNSGTPFSIPTDQRIFTDTTQDPTMQLLVLLVTMIGYHFSSSPRRLRFCKAGFQKRITPVPATHSSYTPQAIWAA